jgi:ribosomal protein S18 acetylase RimI-like enzyme
MKIPDQVINLIQEEQTLQPGKFILKDSSYLKKLEDNAELVVHNLIDGCGGFVFFYCNDPQKESSYITLIITSPNARKKGLGSCLVEYVLKITKQRGFKRCALEVRKENYVAIKLYESLGFMVVEDRGEKYLMQVEVQ